MRLERSRNRDGVVVTDRTEPRTPLMHVRDSGHEEGIEESKTLREHARAVKRRVSSLGGHAGDFVAVANASARRK